MEKELTDASRTSPVLLKRLKVHDDHAAWDEFYQTYWRVVYGYAGRFGLSHNEAEDVVQEVFIKVFRKLPSFEYNRTKGYFRSWIKTITEKTVYDFSRRRKTRLEGQSQIAQNNDEDSGSSIDQIADTQTADGSDPWQEETEQSLLALALERIKERVDKVTFAAFSLHALENKPVKEIAKALNISANSVYVCKNRILTQLKNEVKALRNKV